MLFEHFHLSFWNSLKLKLFAVNNRQGLNPNLWCFCAEQFFPSIIKISDQQVVFSISAENQNIYFSAIYASTSYVHR